MVWLLWSRRHQAAQEPDAEHPKSTLHIPQTYQLRDLAVRIAADVPDDAEAVAAVKAAGGRPKDWKRAAALILADRYSYEHRNDRRAARLLLAAADARPPVAASSDEEALFRAVDGLEALPIEAGFAVLASEIPALRELEHQVVISRSAPGWADRDADDRVAEILDDLAQLVGPEAPEGSPLSRSEAAFGYARVYLLGKVGLLSDDSVPQPEDGQSEKTDLLALLARGYGVAPDLKRVAKAMSKRVADRDGFSTLAVLILLLQEPGIGARLRRGDGPSDSRRKSMTRIVAINAPHLSPAEFVDAVLEEVRSTLLRVSGDGDH